MLSHQAWLICKVSPGQFSEEYAINAMDHNGAEFSLFVSKSNVEHCCGEIEEGDECEGRIRVTVLKEEHPLALIRLPGRTFANGSTVTVKSDRLEAIETSQT
jgi:hypothetical protein